MRRVRSRFGSGCRGRLIGLGLVSFAATSSAETIERNYHESFPVTDATVLHLEHGDGRVRVSAWNEPRIDVEVAYLAEYQGEIPGPDLDFTVLAEADGIACSYEGSRRAGRTTSWGPACATFSTSTASAPRARCPSTSRGRTATSS